MNKEVEELLRNNVENVNKKKQERKEVTLKEFEVFKESVFKGAKANSRKINAKIFEAMLSIFYDRLGKGYELSVSMQSLLSRSDREKLDTYYINKKDIKLINYLKSISDKSESVIHFFDNGSIGELIPFMYEKALYEKLGIKLQNTFSYNSDMFKVDEDVFVERLKLIANGEIKVRNKKRLEVIKEYYEDFLEKYDIIVRFNKMSEENAKRIYLYIYRELIEKYNNMKVSSYNSSIGFPIQYIDVDNQEPIFNNELLNSYLKLGIRNSERILLIPYKAPDEEEITYLPLKAGDLSKLYYHDKAFQAEITNYFILVKSTVLDLEDAIMQVNESYERKLQ